MGEFLLLLDISWSTEVANGYASRVPTDVHVFRGVPHAFRRYGDKLSASKYWDQVMNDGVTWPLSNPAAGPFEIKSN